MNARWKSVIFRLSYKTVLLFAFGASALHSVNAQQLPSSPLSPSLEDCRALVLEYHQRMRSIYSAKHECTRKEPIFGLGDLCSRKTKPYSVVKAYMAWSQCDGYEHEECAILNARSKESPLCYERAKAFSGTLDSDAFVRLKKINDAYESITRRFHQVNSLISDPVKFFQSEAISAATKAALPSWTTHQSIAADPRAQELFRYLDNLTKAGLKTANAPLSVAIQQAAFDEILAHFRRLSDDLTVLQHDIHNFSVEEVAGASLSKPNNTGFQGRHVPNQDLCKLLRTC